MNTLKRYRTAFQFWLLLSGAVALSSQPVRAEESCGIHLGQADVDYGQIYHPGNATSLDSSNLYAVGTRYVSRNASCPASSRLMLILRGESVAEHFRFASRSQIQIRLSNASLDSRTVDLALIRAIGELPGLAASTVDVAPGDLIVPVSGGLAAEGSLLSLQIEVSLGVSMDELKIRDRKFLEGNMGLKYASIDTKTLCPLPNEKRLPRPSSPRKSRGCIKMR
ncbi:hypothetical protein ACI77I_24560 [Pseudomonas sp. D47]|uniref:hypothetical protein n=1 Tax=Pseudomonas sp. D47 TaxID=3159447 RepID=UPI00387B08A6